MFAGGTCGRPRARYHLDFWFPVQTSLKIGFEPPQRQARISLSAVSSVVYLYSPYVLIVLVSRYAPESYFDYIHRPPHGFRAVFGLLSCTAYMYVCRAGSCHILTFLATGCSGVGRLVYDFSRKILVESKTTILFSRMVILEAVV